MSRPIMDARPLLLLSITLIACGPERGGVGWPDASADEGVLTDVVSDTGGGGHDAAPDVPLSNDMTIVYAHSDSTLYTVDPRSNTFTTVGAFAFPTDANAHTMTDIAVDAQGGIVGTTSNALYRVIPATAACTLLASLPGSHTFVGLTYLPVGVLDPSNEVLVGGATDGTYWRIDPMTGAATMLGRFQGGWQLSGDIVSIAGAGTYATVRQSSSATDSLAELNPNTGALTIVGDTHYHSIFGLGYWRSTLYGFTRTGQFLTISSTTAAATLVSTPVTQFSGAGVTTLAPVAPP